MENFEAGRDDDGRRLDRILRKLLPEQSLGRLFKALRRRDILLNGKKAKGETRVSAGDHITVHSSLLKGSPPSPLTVPPAHPTLPPIIHETQDLIFINKPRGVLSHGPRSLAEGVEALWRRRGGEKKSLSFRPGPLHRLDRNTSGLITFSLTLEGAQVFSQALKSGRLEKSYLALVEGIPRPARGRWEDELQRQSRGSDRKTRVVGTGNAAESRGTSREGRQNRQGQWAVTEYDCLLSRPAGGGNPALSLIRCRLLTGRTHQIRAQAAAAGHPLRGDGKYGSRQRGPYLLHAHRLEDTAAPPLFPPLTAPPPPPFLQELGKLFDEKDIENALKDGHN